MGWQWARGLEAAGADSASCPVRVGSKEKEQKALEASLQPPHGRLRQESCLPRQCAEPPFSSIYLFLFNCVCM